MGTKNKISFSDAVQAIVANHKKLYDLILAVLPAYRGEDKMPPRERRISHILNCEENDAHLLLERLATAAKSKPRGSLGADPDLLIAECRSLLDFLEDNLPNPECAAALNDTCQIEEAFVNFIKGISGADPKITRRAYAERIDKFVRDIKDSFRNLGSSIVKMEFTQFRFLQKPKLNAHGNQPPSKRKKRGRAGSGLKGKRTDRMCEQLTAFSNLLSCHPIDERKQGRSIGERAHQFWMANCKTFEKYKNRLGENKGFSCHKTLAAAFRKS